MTQLDELISNLIREQKLMCSGITRTKTPDGRTTTQCPNKAVGYRWRQESTSAKEAVPAIIAWCQIHETDFQVHDTIEVVIDDQGPANDGIQVEPEALKSCPHIAAVQRVLQEQHVSIISEDEITAVCGICNGGVVLG